MKYVGSKERHCKEILPIIMAGRKGLYVEPFIGGASVISKVTGPRLGADLNPHVIELWSAIRDGWIPPVNISEAEYRKARDCQVVDALTAFIGFGCSFAGKWFGGYARGNDANGNPRNYAAESSRAAVKKRAGLVGADLVHCSYDELSIPDGSTVYCDPPYAGTQGYATGGFDHGKFWNWCDDLIKRGCKVFVSEYSAPDGWRCIWEKQVNNTLDKDTGAKKGVERLFTK
ncbi:adenine methyltransferase [Xanthomonas phage Kintu]